jgi:hypothetical protein
VGRSSTRRAYRDHPAAALPALVRRIGTRQVAVAVVGLLVLGGAAAYGVTRLTGGDDSGNAHADSDGKPRRDGAAVKPGNVTAAVLNGTTVPGLAAMLSDQIAAAGRNRSA